MLTLALRYAPARASTFDLETVIQAALNSPYLAALGLLVLLALILAPIALRLAGLTGDQVVRLLQATMQFILEVIKDFRNSNSNPPQQ